MKKEYVFRIEREYLADSLEEAEEMFVADVSRNNFEVERVEEDQE